MTGFLLKWILASSGLIVAVLFLRGIFGRKISARLRYALWAAVLLRLLIPVQLFRAPVETPQVFSESPAFLQPRFTAGAGLPAEQNGAEQTAGTAAPVQTLPVPGKTGSDIPPAKRPPDPFAVWVALWLAGSAVMTLALSWSNLRFSRRLRRIRSPFPADGPLRVYLVPRLPSPCLFGTFAPAVYIPSATAEDPVRLRHVLAHESTHFRHGDHIWSLLRCAALAVHWWNPLVWLSAALSRQDAELACDEGALKHLGNEERQAYGNTLLTLVTAKPQPGDLLCCATTMKGSQRSLRERVRRIAQAPRRWLLAAVLSTALAALVCACSFAKTETQETPEDRPLTAEELERFNIEFNDDTSGFNIRRQFLFLAVEAPKDYRQIDLFQLFYNGAGPFESCTGEERQAVADAGYGGENPMTDLIKCPREQMDAVLQEYLGFGLEDTDKWGLDQFTYLPEYDAYYHFHGDSNSSGRVEFSAGEWKDGKILLYYTGYCFPVLSNGDGSWIFTDETDIPACVTLEPQDDGGYHFLSNWRCDPPVISTAYPSWDPELAIPLDRLEPYQPEAVTVERHTGDYAEGYYTVRFEPNEFSTEGFDVSIYLSTDGNTYAAVLSEDGYDCFLTLPQGTGPEADIAAIFTDLFGQSGLVISYYSSLDGHHYGMVHDYYTFTDGGTPSLLLRTQGETVQNDLDGDGAEELAASGGDTAQLFFQRDGRLWEANIESLLREAWPEAGYLSSGFWDADSRCLNLSAEVPIPGTDETATAFRTLWFDGENLRLYRDRRDYANHIKVGLDAPAEVLSAARDFAEAQFLALAAKGFGTDGSGNYSEEHFGPGNVVWDDWAVTELNGPFYETAGDLQVEIWNVGYETHTATPDRVILAGGSYRGEDGWCMIGYPVCDYLFFRLNEDGSRTYLFTIMENDCYPGTEVFREDFLRTLAAEGLLNPEQDPGN